MTQTTTHSECSYLKSKMIEVIALFQIHQFEVCPNQSSNRAHYMRFTSMHAHRRTVFLRSHVIRQRQRLHIPRRKCSAVHRQVPKQD